MPMIPFVKNGFYASRGWTPLVRGNGEGGGVEPEPDPVWDTITGNPVSFETIKQWPLRQLQVAFSPVQSLNGYDAPWPAGGGKNKFDQSAHDAQTDYATSSGNYMFSEPLLLKPNTIYTFAPDTNTDLPTTGIYFAVYVVSGDDPSAFSGDYKYVVYNGKVVESAIRNVFTTGATGAVRFAYNRGITQEQFASIFAKNWQLEEGRDATAWTPYSNECPISGWSSLTVEQRGKNLLNINSPDITFNRYTDFSNGVISNQIADTRTAPWSFIINAYDSNGTSILQKNAGFSGAGRISIPLAIPANAVSLLCRYSGTKLDCGFRTPIDITGNCVFSADVLSADLTTIGGLQIGNFQLELGSSPSPYQPYNPLSRSISISLGQTVYSGYVDVISGVGEITWAKAILNGNHYLHNWFNVDTANNSWGLYINGYEWTRNDADYLGPAPNNTQANATISNVLQYGGVYNNENIWHGSFAFNQGAFNYYAFRIPKSAIGGNPMSAEELDTLAKAYLASNPIEVCYPLATPIPFHVDPQEVSSLLGENVVWSTANGNLTVEYRSN